MCELVLTSSFLSAICSYCCSRFPGVLDLQITSLCLVSVGAVLLFQYAQKLGFLVCADGAQTRDQDVFNLMIIA